PTWIVYLVRDPRGIYASRRSSHLCEGDGKCEQEMQPSFLCNKMHQDFMQFQQFVNSLRLALGQAAGKSWRDFDLFSMPLHHLSQYKQLHNLQSSEQGQMLQLARALRLGLVRFEQLIQEPR